MTELFVKRIIQTLTLIQYLSGVLIITIPPWFLIKPTLTEYDSLRFRTLTITILIMTIVWVLSSAALFILHKRSHDIYNKFHRTFTDKITKPLDENSTKNSLAIVFLIALLFAFGMFAFILINPS